jgi:hypothetical protein
MEVCFPFHFLKFHWSLSSATPLYLQIIIIVIIIIIIIISQGS